MPYTNINGVQLYWERSGDAGEPLVLVHGSWVDHHNWGPVVPYLSEEYRVLTYDRRGHSRSERPATPGSIHDDVADLAALIEELDLTPAHVIGNSFGGSIALRLAAERPDLCRTVLVTEPPLPELLLDQPNGQQMLEQMSQGLGAVEELLAAGDMEGGVRYFVENIVFGPGTWEQLPAELRETVTFNAPTFLGELRDPDAFTVDPDRLRSVSRPVLLMTCGESPPPFQAIVKRLADELPHAELRVFPGARHEPARTHPEEYVNVVTDFIRTKTGEMMTRRMADD